jgi:glycosyltransferase involved in cell wall biosynthesis
MKLADGHLPAALETRRVAVLSPCHWACRMGGAELQMRYLLDRLVREERYDICYFARDTLPGFCPDGYRVSTVAPIAGARSGLADILPLLKALKEFQPDVIYQRVGGAYTAAAAWYTRGSKARLIWHIAHDSDVIPGMIPQGGRLRPDRWLEKRALEFGIRHADAVIAQTEAQRALLEENYQRDVTAVIANFHPAPPISTRPQDPTVALWIANFKPIKQPEALLRVARELGDSNVTIQIVGRVPQHRYGELLAELERLPNVQYLGELTGDQVNERLDQAHLLVNTSSVEGFPNTFAQAWLRQVPVLSLQVDPDNVLARESLGFCAGGSEIELARAIRRLAENPVQRTQIGRAAREYAIKYHSLENASRIVSLLDERP